MVKHRVPGGSRPGAGKQEERGGWPCNTDNTYPQCRNIPLFQDYSDDDMDLAASETHYDSVPFTELGLSSPGDKEARQEPMRRRK